MIAISGGNIAILAGLFLGALWLLGIRDGWAAAAAAATLAAYAFMAGGGASVVRATVMAAIYLLLRVIDQRTSPLHAMSLTAIAILLASPLSIADVGLWLTFGATAAIIAGVTRVPLPSTWWLRGPAVLLLASLSAEVVLMPIGAFDLPTGHARRLERQPGCRALHGRGADCGHGDDGGRCNPLRTAGEHLWLGHPPQRARLAWQRGTRRLGAVADMARAFAAAGRCRDVLRRRGDRGPSAEFDNAAGCSRVACVLFGWMAIAPPTLARRFGDGRLHLTMMDVGQGDAMLVTFPNGRTLLVDAGGVSAGGGFDVGDRVLGPALRHRGIGRLDYLAITHADLDHIGGAASLARDFAPAEVWYGTFVEHHEPTDAVTGDGRSSACRLAIAA